MRHIITLMALVAGTLVPAAGAFGAPSASSHDDATGVGVRLVDAPVATREDPRARVYIIDHVAPGTLIERRIEVSNNTGSEAKVSVYPAAATIKDGSFVGLEADTPNELTTWMSVSRPVLRLADGEEEMVKVSIDVPADAPPGEQYAVAWAQVSSKAPDSGVTQVSRVGIRIYLSVGPGGAPASDFEIQSLTSARAADGTPVVQAQVENTGGRALDMRGTLKLTDGPGGLSAGPFPVSLGTTLSVGQTTPVEVVLDEQLPNGPWKAELEITSGLLTRTAQATITFPDAGTGESVTPETGLSLWWWVGIAAAVLLALLAVAASWLGRRRRTTTDAAALRTPETTHV